MNIIQRIRKYISGTKMNTESVTETSSTNPLPEFATPQPARIKQITGLSRFGKQIQCAIQNTAEKLVGSEAHHHMWLTLAISQEWALTKYLKVGFTTVYGTRPDMSSDQIEELKDLWINVLAIHDSEKLMVSSGMRYIPVDLATPDKIEEWVTNYIPVSVGKRLRKYIKDNELTAISHLAIPLAKRSIPASIIPITDTKLVIAEIMRPTYAILYNYGFSVGVDAKYTTVTELNNKEGILIYEEQNIPTEYRSIIHN